MSISRQTSVQHRTFDPFNICTANKAHMLLMGSVEQNSEKLAGAERTHREGYRKGHRSNTNQEHDMKHNRTDVGKQRRRSTEVK